MPIYQKIYDILKQVEAKQITFAEAFAAVSLLVGELEESSRLMGMLSKAAETGENKDLFIPLMYLERKLSIALKDEDFLESMSADLSSYREPMDLIVVLDNVRSAWNIGNMIRSAEAFLTKEVWLSGYTAGLDQEKVVKASLGSHENLPIKDFEQQDLDFYKAEGYKVYGLETIESAKAMHSVELNKKTIFVLGNERFGISKDMKKNIDDYIYIPMQGLKRSINVGNALAISLYEYMRQNGKF